MTSAPAFAMLSGEAKVEPQNGHLHCRELFERLCAAAEGEDPPCAELAAHLRSCEPCRRVLESLEATRKALSAFGGSPAFPPAESQALLQECLQKLREAGHLES